MIPNMLDTADAPEGFKIPKAAVNLLNIAAWSGWKTGWQWNEDNGGAPFVTVHVADPDTREYFKYTWHSRGTGTLRLFSKLHQRSAGRPWTDGPSVKDAIFRVREVADQRN